MQIFITIMLRLKSLEIYLSQRNRTPEAISRKLCCLRLVKFTYIIYLFAFLILWLKMTLYIVEESGQDSRTDKMWVASSLL